MKYPMKNSLRLTLVALLGLVATDTLARSANGAFETAGPRIRLSSKMAGIW